ncbi:insulinase family protein [Deinococcus sp. KNUC1210]|uniref:M16 family metallopeptidase n=1 Tax=Deinococcus sp. KNUC1210 TaxID=2917691 RepID=UPI001EF10A0F|nr:pitrilysin family protein [Deinococcus sp. KNUC1210]ULH15965.1 insulinase family protein [Deinococcus sp. KNUC1210]
MKRTRLTAALSALLLLGPPLHAQSTATSAPPAALTTTAGVRQTILSNGLTVLTKEVRGAPVVSVQVFYKIGSRNEAAGVNGIAHQLEHMMFKGTTTRPVQFGRLLGALGADFNAFTSYDQTAYHETVQREKAGAVLALEADRMVNAQIDAEKLAGERRVVLSEIEGDENDPQYRLSRAVQAAAFPNSPYGLTVGGTRTDIEGFSADKVRAYYKKYYSPEYATLVIVGDFQTDAMLKDVQKYFGGLGKPGTKPVKTSAPLVGTRSEATLGSPAVKAPIVLKEPGAAPLLSAVYPLPDINSPDVPALKVLDYILLSGRTSRLYTSLFESGVAADGGTSPNHLLNGGWYEFNFTPAPGTTLPTLDKALLTTLADVRKTPPTADEVKQAITQIRAGELLGSVSVDAQAGSLGMDATTAGDYRYTDRFLAALTRVTPADVQRVAQKYLQDSSRTVGYFEPTQAQEGQASAATGATQEAFNAGPPVDPAEVAKYLPAFPAPGSTTVSLPEQFRLPNGLTVFLLRDAGTPTVSLSANVLAGREFDTDAKAGLVDLVAGNLLSGTTTRDEATLARLIDGVGAQLAPSASRFGVSIDGASLSADLPTLIEGLSDVLQHATFPAAQFKTSQARAVQAVRQSDDSPGSVAQKVFRKTVYPAGNPWQVFSTAQSLGTLTQADLSAFYAAHYRPDTTVITLVGNFDVAQTKALLTQKFSGWKASGAAPSVAYPVVGKPSGIVRVNPALPGKTQAVTYLGYQSIDRKDPRYYASLVLNQVLGGDTLSSRLGTELRDKQGLTYGVSSGFSAGKQAGPFIVTLQTNPADTEKAVQAALSLIQKVRDEGLSATEVNTAKNTLTSSFTVGLSNPAALAQTFTGFYSEGLPLDELRLYPQKIAAVTLAQVNAAAKSLLDPQNIVIVTAGPTAPSTQ